MSMINWDEFEHIHVIKKLKEILSTWWNIDVVFTDERGVIKGFDGEKNVFSNPAVSYLVNKETGQSSLETRFWSEQVQAEKWGDGHWRPRFPHRL